MHMGNSADEDSNYEPGRRSDGDLGLGCEDEIITNLGQLEREMAMVTALTPSHDWRVEDSSHGRVVVC